MNHRMQQFGCLLAVSMLFSGCVATKPAEPAAAKQTEAAPAVNKTEAAAPNATAAKPAPKATVKAAAGGAVEPEKVDPDALKPALEAPMPDKPCDLYNVEVSANRTSLAVGTSVSLYVHVKATDFPLTGHEAHGVKVTFSGLGFAAQAPASECLRVHPNGSEIIYNVTAANAGTYNVIANVAFYPTRDCVTSGVSKASNPLTVTVK